MRQNFLTGFIASSEVEKELDSINLGASEYTLFKKGKIVSNFLSTPTKEQIYNIFEFTKHIFCWKVYCIFIIHSRIDFLYVSNCSEKQGQGNQCQTPGV